MIIRKLFKFENAHIVRNCTSRRCSRSIHGHSYKVEVKLSSNYLDNGEMVYDFGLMKVTIKDLIDSFDHAITLWAKDDDEYIEYAKKFSERWIVLPVNPSAEQFSRVFFIMIDRVLNLMEFNNGEKEVKLHSIVVHETDTGYAECFREDAYNFKGMGEIKLEDIVFSDRIKEEWNDSRLWDKLLREEKLTPPKEI
ncbi:putative 6-pyruvoyl tetrahydrobiopterin synthase [Nautilia profundicola AmH]|uniref:6-carboxy-5,6,7,8-tetrahydropterin synthase n=1 Tax=Nautilia profundicola (strain ATCC BAA-1463 / DSM 18972 / AmH) TaxID=598659 RepID=B9L875_NAUPA|nr:6-carboxytetrahydropterin synthase [Nautilia profundicola]ACM92628.1 putative 6-pyruvoyl tetrahydrobiopterin synthase [Nautilia profundicola AmH]